LSINGVVTSNQANIRNHAVRFYESLFTECYNWRPRLDNLGFDSLDASEAARLETLFEEREVLEVVKGMNRDKASGLDGFSMAFFQDYWLVINEDIMVVLEVNLRKALMLRLFLSFQRFLGHPS
jgi:hypothetical protein